MTSPAKKIALYVLMISAMAFATRITNNMISTTAPLIAKYSYGMNSFEVGLTGTLIYAATLVSTALINPRLDSKMRKNVFVSASILATLSEVLLLLGTIPLFWLSIGLFGFFTGFLFTNLITSISMVSEGVTRERFLAGYSISLSLGLVIGPTIETETLSFLPYNLIILEFLPFMIVVSALSFLVKFKEKNETKGISGIGKNPGFLTSILAITAYNVPFAAFTVFMAIYLRTQFHVSLVFSFSVYILFFLTSFVTRIYLFIRPLRAIKKPLFFLIYLTIICVVLIPVLTVFHNVYAVLFVIAVLGIPHGGIFPISTIMLSRGVPRESLNAANSYFMSYNNVLFIIIPAIFGAIADIQNELYAFAYMAIAPIISLALIKAKYAKNSIVFHS
ncbi:MAG: transporter [Thermoplasmatales archaeon E-plasma]|jgi:MFS family permease|nr:MAG: transporter [Thermoplasmatales archaeon E-plasma]